MPSPEPTSPEPTSTEIDARYSAPGSAPTPWAEALRGLAAAEVYWLSTVRPDGQPHVTPLLSVWLDGALHFTSGAGERKVRNLAANPKCVLTTGDSALDRGLDLVVEGSARQVGDEAGLRRIADAFVAKYGEEWRYEVHDGAFRNRLAQRALVYRVPPSVAFGFRKGEYAQTRWLF
ncbi:pyridoxamine 5'-phosphate oxidase family protein [Streptomyces hainanensis]|uniref:Pyridoxamine 5'-phosphate oxidase family protein n=1 Tax=Streptomyces hainanensis TaxID=402648 RepID=A0A4V2Y3B1_9ACTN|nr:pyridoxamine 5'-phosphate oxidase family protein [Streptomyces hainanensis]TDC75855.1 pyridoxamine 5'-phosphate oxidase family protein [Streptomyces hainanensis]